MAERVVDLLEAVEVDEDHARLPLGLAVDRAVCLRQERPSVWQPGEVIVVGELLDLVELAREALRDAAQHWYEEDEQDKDDALGDAGDG